MVLAKGSPVLVELSIFVRFGYALRIKIRGECTMKKALIIANVLFASSTVLGMNPSLPIDSGQSSSTTPKMTDVTDSKKGTVAKEWEKIRSEKKKIRKAINNKEEREALLSPLNKELELKTKVPIKIIKSMSTEDIVHNLLAKGFSTNQKSIKLLSPKTIQAIFFDIEKKNFPTPKPTLSAIILFSNLVNSKGIVEFLSRVKDNIPTSDDDIKTFYNKTFQNVRNFINYCLGEYPLRGAIKNGNEEIVKYLIKLGAHKNELGVLSYAVYHGRENLMKYLVGHGVDINEVYQGKTALGWASYYGHGNMVKYLVEHGADINEVYKNHGNTPLSLAAYKGHKNVVKYLVEQGANVNKEDKNGMTPLFLASEFGYEPIVKYLVEHGANINKVNNRGETPFYIACERGYENIVKYLVEHGADVNKEDKNGMTPLFLASEFGYEPIVKYLVEHGADVNKDDGNGHTPLGYAAYRGYENIVKYLVEHGAE